MFTRLRYQSGTRDYSDRRTTEGKTRREIIRCLKRYVAREIYNLLPPSTNTSARPTALTNIGASEPSRLYPLIAVDFDVDLSAGLHRLAGRRGLTNHRAHCGVASAVKDFDCEPGAFE